MKRSDKGRRVCAWVGSCLVAGFVLAEGRLRRDEAARSWQAGQQDRGTTAAVGMSFGVAMTAGPFVARWRRGTLPTPLGWMGVGAMAGGLTLRIAAARALGSHYTRTLRTEGKQPVVTDGPYRYVRHPGYAGVLAMWFGYGLAMTSAPATLITTLPNIVAYVRRMDAEEAMLTDALGETYRAYRDRTSRLVPGLY